MGHMSTTDGLLCVISNSVTALAYCWLTSQLVAFAVNSKLAHMTQVLRLNKDKKKRQLFYMMLAIAILFAAFIVLCGGTHLLNVLKFYYPTDHRIHIAQLVMLVLCAVVSVLTAIIGSKVFPVILETLTKFELNSEGNLQHAENYMIEVVVKESIIVLSENFQIVRCNQASNILLSTPDCTGNNFTDFIHPQDLQIFKTGVSRVMGSFSASSQVTIEYRVNQSIAAAGRLKPISPKVRPGRSAKVAPTCAPLTPAVGVGMPHDSNHDSVITPDSSLHNQSIYSQSTALFAAEASPPVASDRSFHTLPLLGIAATAPEVQTEVYVWVESTICKGMSMNDHDDFVYDIKLVSRNIEDRKKVELTQYNEIVKENEERARINSAKMRYISCIAHDLKTPLQSFCFSLDLLNHTPMVPEQREYVQQANVAVDLMKLTISQTMDISKALTGAKLMPRRTTVYLSTVLHRVEVIISGFGKQVPVSFEVAQEVCDRIITDEEWLWQMLLNLLTNACKYTDRGEIKVKVSLSSGSTDHRRSFEDEMLLVEVVDTGVGVAEEKIGTMFDAFSQLQEGQPTGTGLGLFGVRARAEGLLGTCGAQHNTESTTGSGTVLWFSIPYVPDLVLDAPDTVAPRGVSLTRTGTAPRTLFDKLPSVDANLEALDPLTAPEEELQFEAAIKAKKLTAIVVDDTKTVCKLMEKLLLKMGFESVLCCSNGAKGLDMMICRGVDVVFSDVQMPIMTGPEMVRRFRKLEADWLETGVRSSRQLIVAVTANGAELGNGNSSGFDEVCPKPLSAQEIYSLVEKYFL